ncbi:hypothetical protein PIB30_002695 [Stylosanthes scabra]|uniref:RNase H type-1 domain-containing protein n=1 Tax=Stylosanthes scabra TaxID=79078 RepID=A0ABU6R240_9FABA|nr:hypothetical protein [Stylosanthes scabra]
MLPTSILMIVWASVVLFEIGMVLGKRDVQADTSAARNDIIDLINRIHELIKRSWRVEFSLIQRTANAVADALARYAILNGVVQVELLTPSDDFKMLLQRDLGE